MSVATLHVSVDKVKQEPLDEDRQSDSEASNLMVSQERLCDALPCLVKQEPGNSNLSYNRTVDSPRMKIEETPPNLCSVKLEHHESDSESHNTSDTHQYAVVNTCDETINGLTNQIAESLGGPTVQPSLEIFKPEPELIQGLDDDLAYQSNTLAMMDKSTMGEIAMWVPPAEQKKYYRNILGLLDKFYPPQWRSWVINNRSYEEIFGEQMSPDKVCRLRFAVPTLSIAEAFNTKSLSERKYKHIKRIMLKWPLGRAIIYAPIDITYMIHPTDANNEFLSTVQALKPKLISGQQASTILKERCDSSENLASLSEVSTTFSSRKRSYSPRDKVSSTKKQKIDKEMTMTDFIKQQRELLTKLCNVIAPGGSLPSPSKKARTELDCDTFGARHPRPIGGHSKQTKFSTQIKEPYQLLDFAPQTKESGGKVGKADETLVAQGIQCQRFDSENWRNISYAEVQKQFQASPVFTNLKINGCLASVTPPWQLVSTLERMDLCLGAITHGLLQQRKAFEDAYNSCSLEVKKIIGKNFLGSESSFRRTSDDLLQYVCGKRAETLKQRRCIYKAQNKTINELLHDIPPSTTHLFAEPQLSEFIKEHGGVNRIFRGKPKPKHFPEMTFEARQRRTGILDATLTIPPMIRGKNQTQGPILQQPLGIRSKS